MKIHFSIPFNTHFGQNIYIFGSIPELSSYDIKNARPMSYDGSLWRYDLVLTDPEDFEYSYILKDGSGTGDVAFEAGPARKFHFSSFDEYIVYDEWKTYSEESPFLSSAFKKVFYLRGEPVCEIYGNVIIKLSANNIPFDTEIAICGNPPYLGNWQPENGRKLHQNNDGLWEVDLKSNELPEIFEYKFVLIKNDNDNQRFIWEEGENRTLEIPILESDTLVTVNHFTINLEARKTRIAGTAIPVFSLRSNESCGMGDFMDLKKMVDFLYKTGQNVLQLLPINDSTMTHTWSDSYPYGAISIYALHPLYLNLEAAGKINDSRFMETFYAEATKYDQLECIDYDAVETLKWSYIKKLYEQDGERTLKSKEYTEYFIQNRDWLVPYSVFCTLRDKYETPEFRKWPEYSTYDKSKIEKLADEKGPHYKKIAIHYFVQFILHKQLTEVHHYANSKKIILKGDIPIGINRNSVDAWVEPYLFNFQTQAGAPPDDFSVKGQNWGFPTYNWDRMEVDGYSWWKRRFLKMAEYFDAYRIDHILGFFRIWEIPADSTEGLMGHFNPSLPLTAEEIKSWGYQFNFNRDCKPYIKEYVLNDYFGAGKEVIKSIFLDTVGLESYMLKDLFSTQSKIENYFISNPSSEAMIYKDGLKSLCSEVLFMQDPIERSKYHPRISAQASKSYQALNNRQQNRFNKVYNDFFYSRNNEFWHRNAMKKLPSLISATGMLVCGEDLGMIPACVPSVMHSLRILSLEIQRMPKNPNEKFGNPYKYPYLSVCTTGTHDTSTIRAWWKEDHDISSEYFKCLSQNGGSAPHNCEPWLCKEIIESHLNSPSMLAIFPIQDWLSISGRLRRVNPNDERINDPSNPKNYWRYRLHLNLEDLIKDEKFSSSVRKMIESSGRILS